MYAIYLNENAIQQIILTEGWIDAKRKELEQQAKIIKAKKAAVYYTWKNGKLFLFFDKKALGISDAISVWFQDIINKILRTIFRVPDPKIEFKIKKGADIHDVKYVLDYYSAQKKLDAIRYNKLCNTWAYLVLPGIDGPKKEQVYRKLIKDLNGIALPEKVLENPEILNEVINCKK